MTTGYDALPFRAADEKYFVMAHKLFLALLFLALKRCFLIAP